MAEQFVELPDRGVTLCVDRAGEGPVLLVLGGTASDIRHQPNALRWPVAEHFDTVIYDHRCLGRSVQHDETYQPTMADFAADALALCDSLGINEFAVIGVSFGGMVAQELACIAGTRLTRLVLCCTSSGGEGGSSFPIHELNQPGRSQSEVADLWDIRGSYDEAVATFMRRLFDGRDRPAVPPPGLLKQIEARRHHDTWHRLQLILCDTLVAHGIYDGVCPPENSERLVERITSAELASFVGGHFFLAQDPEAFLRITKFLHR